MRKLACAALAFAGAAAAAHYVLPFGALLWCAGGLALLCLPFALLLRETARLRAIIICAFAALGLCWYAAYTHIYVQPAAELAGQEMMVTARVLDYPERDEDYASVELRIEQEGLPRLKTAVYDYDGLMPELRPGDVAEFPLEFIPALEKYGEETDIYSSRGILLRAYLSGGPENVRRDLRSCLSFPMELANAVRKTVKEVFPQDVQAFMLGLLIGDTGGLYDDYELDNALSVAGIRHVVAVSGMHLSFLYAVLTALFGKRRASVVGVPVLVLFTFVAGCTASVVRACVMLILVMTAPLLRREADGITSLCAGLLILLIANPLSIAAAGLQLSFAAMAGMILLTPRVYAKLDSLYSRGDKKRRPNAVLRFVMASVSSSVGSMAFTTPVVALLFGYVSLVAPLTNLVTLWAVSVAFTAGYAAVLCGLVFAPLGTAVAWTTAWFARYISFAAKTLAALPYSAIYTVDRLVPWWLVLAYAEFGAAWLLRDRKRGFRALAPTVCSMLTLAFVLFSAWSQSRSESSVTVLDVGQGQSVAVLHGEHAVLVDCGGKSSWDNAGDTAAEYLLGRGRSSIDAVVLTHLHADHANGVERLLSRVDVDELYLPFGADDEDGMLEGILDSAQRHGTVVKYVTGGDIDTAYGGLSLKLFEPIEAGDENERGVIVLASVGEFDTLIMGDVNTSVERRLVERSILPDTELLVVGHHGSKYSTCFELLEEAKAETAVISVGWNSYGHPTEETLRRLEICGLDIYRTDEDGSVTVRTGYDGKEE